MNTFRRLAAFVTLGFLFLRELVTSATKVAYLTLQPRSKIHPAIIAYPLTVPSDGEITLLANLITLTPGTLSVELSADRKWLYVHCLNAPDAQAVINSIAGGFETAVMRLFR